MKNKIYCNYLRIYPFRNTVSLMESAVHGCYYSMTGSYCISNSNKLQKRKYINH